ncbi:MAG: hypothetical protein CMQ82_03220 [Gammaproteobacteria bacterium]|nr:hypothetical protein [Gammaproteobacteria bacterium]
MIKHDGDADNVDENADIDIFILNTELETVSSSAGLDRFEYAEIPAGLDDIFYIIVDHYRGYNSESTAYIIKNTPSSSTNEAVKTKLHQSNSDINIGKLLIAQKDFNADSSINNNLKNEITLRMDGYPAKLVEISTSELSELVGLPNDQEYLSSLKENFIDTYKIGRWRKATNLLKQKLPEIKVDLDYKKYLHVDFVKDPLHDGYQWWSFDIMNLPEGLEILGTDVKPINVAVLDSGGPYEIDLAYQRSIFDSDRGWDMEDNDPLPDDVEFEQGEFSHGTHVGSTISMLNDGIDANGFGARVTPVRVCFEGGCGPTYEAYLFINGDENESETSWAERTAISKGLALSELDEKLHAMNMSYGGGGSATSNACQKLAEISESGVLIASSSGNGGIGSMNYPAACPTVFSVAATNGTHRRSSYSSTNEFVDFAAPGGEYSDWNDDSIDDLVYAYARIESEMIDSPVPLVGAQGTSMSSPHGAGFLGLLKYYYEEISRPFNENTNLPDILKYNHVEQMLKGNLLTNDVNKISREFDTTARPGRDDHLGYGIIDLEKAIKSVDAFKNGYFDSFDNLPYYQTVSNVKLEKGTTSEFEISPNGRAGPDFNSITYSFNNNFIEVDDLGNSNYSVKIAPDYNSAGWVLTPITFEFPLLEGVVLPYAGYEILASNVEILFHIKGASQDLNIPSLKVNLLNENDEEVQTTYTDILNGEGSIALTDIADGFYKLQVCSDINGDSSWCGSGELAGLSEIFEVSSSSVSQVNLSVEATSEGVPNNAPVIISNPENSDATVAAVGQDYLYRVLAEDEDYVDENNPANNGKPPRSWFDYSIEIINQSDGSSGDFLTIDIIGEVKGTPENGDGGNWTIRIGVSDRIDTTIQEYTLAVDE